MLRMVWSQQFRLYTQIHPHIVKNFFKFWNIICVEDQFYNMVCFTETIQSFYALMPPRNHDLYSIVRLFFVLLFIIDMEIHLFKPIPAINSKD